MKYYFSIPDFYRHFALNEKLLNLFNKHSEMINDGVVIESVYGCFPMAAWNGGRIISGATSAMNAEKTIEFFNTRGISCRYTFTNSLLEQKHLYDTWCNVLMKAANNGKNGVTVASDLLNDYLRETYPNFYRVSSTTKVIRTIDEFNAECERDFAFCVLHYDFNNCFDELAKIMHPEKTEIMVNEFCIPNCKAREAHYGAISRGQLEFRDATFTSCPGNVDNYQDVMCRPHYISYQDIVEKYAPLGFNHFKIVGRNSARKDFLIEAYVQYFIKPEWQTTARLMLNS